MELGVPPPLLPGSPAFQKPPLATSEGDGVAIGSACHRATGPTLLPRAGSPHWCLCPTPGCGSISALVLMPHSDQPPCWYPGALRGGAHLAISGWGEGGCPSFSMPQPQRWVLPPTDSSPPASWAESSWGPCPLRATEAAPAPAVWLGKVPSAALSWKGQTQGQGTLRARQEKVLGKRWHDAECQDTPITCSLRLQSTQRRAACTVLPGERLLPRVTLSHPSSSAGLY